MMKLKMITRVSVVVVGGLLLAGVPASAHHAFASEFDANQPVTLTGKLTRVEWINPHGWLYIDVETPDGTVESWRIETGAPNRLLRRGIRAADFEIGVELVIEGFRAKRAPMVANGSDVTFVDGRNFFLGSSGTGAPQRTGAP